MFINKRFFDLWKRKDNETIEFHYERFSNTKAFNYYVTIKFTDQPLPYNSFSFSAFDFNRLYPMIISDTYELIETKQLDGYYPPPLNDRIEIWKKKKHE